MPASCHDETDENRESAQRKWSAGDPIAGNVIMVNPIAGNVIIVNLITGRSDHKK